MFVPGLVELIWTLLIKYRKTIAKFFTQLTAIIASIWAAAAVIVEFFNSILEKLSDVLVTVQTWVQGFAYSDDYSFLKIFVWAMSLDRLMYCLVIFSQMIAILFVPVVLVAFAVISIRLGAFIWNKIDQLLEAVTW